MRRWLMLACVVAVVRPAAAESLAYLCFFGPGEATVTDRCRSVVRTAFTAWDSERRGQRRNELDPSAPPLPAQTEHLEVRGYAPDGADAGGRTSLGLARARAVADELHLDGVPPDSVSVAGFADRDMLVPDSPDDPQNHRAQIVFLP